MIHLVFTRLEEALEKLLDRGMEVFLALLFLRFGILYLRASLDLLRRERADA